MSTAQIIDMSKLPPPQVVEVLDFEAQLAELKADLIEALPGAAATLELESEPLTKWLSRLAYQIVIHKAQANESALATMLPYAKGADLDNIGAWFDTPRLVITPADPDASPPVEAVMEEDESFRERIHLAPHGFSVAGPEKAYVYHARGASGQVLDAWPYSPTPGQVVVSVLARAGNGAAPAELLAAVTAALSATETRPLTDEVIVQSATIREYAIDAVVSTLPGPDPATVIDQAKKAAQAYAASMHRIKRTPTLSGILAALQVAGVHRVTLASPLADVVCDGTQASYCTSVTVTPGGTSE
jgi:phage-related baseplate assembly protein